MREYKYYGTVVMLNPNEKFIETYGGNHHNQYRIVCKAKSFAEVCRIGESLGMYKPFSKAYTGETGNKIEIEACNKYGFVICTKGTFGEEYVDIREALKV